MLSKKEIAKIVVNRSFRLNYARGKFSADGRAITDDEVKQLRRAVEDEPGDAQE